MSSATSCRRASAADPKFAHTSRRVRVANFGFKSGTRIIELASVLSIPKFAQRSPRGLANFGIGTLASCACREWRVAYRLVRTCVSPQVEGGERMELSYTQNLEDYHLSLAFAGQATGTYVD